MTAQFFSHTHLNEIQLFKEARKERPFSVAYVAPSLTPWQNVNPSYRIYSVDGARGNQSTWVRRCLSLCWLSSCPLSS